MIFYHRTTEEAADAILRTGFRDATGTFGIGRKVSGVWFSAFPFDGNDGAKGDVLLEIDLDEPESDLAEYEWVADPPRPVVFREWQIPAAVANRGAVRRLTVEEDDAIFIRRVRERQGRYDAQMTDGQAKQQ